MIKVGILGAAGYTGGELIRVLLNHPTTLRQRLSLPTQRVMQVIW